MNPKRDYNARRKDEKSKNPSAGEQSGKWKSLNGHQSLALPLFPDSSNDSAYDCALESISCDILLDTPFFGESFVFNKIGSIAIIGNHSSY